MFKFTIRFVCFEKGAGSYSKAIKKVEEDIKNSLKKVNELTGESEKLRIHINYVHHPQAVRISFDKGVKKHSFFYLYRYKRI